MVRKLAFLCKFPFQFTRPRGGAISSRPARRPRTCFNSHAPVGARFCGVAQFSDLEVSIHTPPWGRDERQNEMVRGAKVSIHTPPWGRDAVMLLPARTDTFQFTRPRGGAIIIHKVGSFRSRFNSHAPVGARYSVRDSLSRVKVSIHTPPWGRDAQSVDPNR